MQKRLHLLVVLLAFVVSTAMAQITTSGISGKVTSDNENVTGLLALDLELRNH